MKSFVGQCLKNRYQVCELLGRQTGRRTFLANDLQTQTKVVLKLMLFGPDFSWEDLKLFEREAATLKSLDHPAIPCYLDYFELSPAETAEIGKGFALVQSYIETKSLQDWADEGRVFSGNDVKEIATQLLEVLIYLHGHQPPVVHRDIKPSNILLRASRFRQLGRVYLVDFGSVQTTQQEGTITIVGTYGYMPPEQFSGRANPASDLYSLGATLIYLLTCKHPADLPMRRGQLDFEVAELVGDRTQSWLQYLVHSSVVQRLQSARWALDTLVDENLPLQSKQGLYAKPHGSRVSLRKTTDRLEISFPRISIKQRLKIVAIASIQTLAIVLFAYLLELAMLFQFDGQFLLSTVAWVIVFAVSGLVCLKIWFDALSTLSASFQILMDAQTLSYYERRVTKTAKRTAVIEDITQVTKSFAMTRTGQKRQLPMLNVWTDSTCFELSHVDRYAGYFQLSWPEVDWLGSELSDWLNLPLRIISQQQVQKEQQQKKKESSLAKPYQPNLPEVHRPSWAMCTLKKDSNMLEVFAPRGRNSKRHLQGRLKALLLSPSREAANTILRIDAAVVSLWDTADLQTCVAQTARQNVSRIRIVYRSGQANKYHIQLEAAYVNSDRFLDHLLVGDRTFWLSQKEAHWLAYELSYWLKLPVSELAVVGNSSAL